MSTDRTTPGPELTPAQVRDRLSTLHSTVLESLDGQFGQTLGDLQQLRGLLGDATGKLSQAFQLMVRQAQLQRDMARTLIDEVDSPAARDIHELAGEISKGAMLVVQSLQFEDMANQLVQHVDKRIAWLDCFARDASLLRTAVREDMIGMSYEEFLAVEERLAELRMQLGVWDRKVVQQQSLDEGEIELF
ncbi:MAG: hypothetical protein IT359_01735 [Gemmatimonadaceae bacterium]|nr:hypothetical protein [Gemmatimonadaceae bacterium]